MIVTTSRKRVLKSLLTLKTRPVMRASRERVLKTLLTLKTRPVMRVSCVPFYCNIRLIYSLALFSPHTSNTFVNLHHEVASILTDLLESQGAEATAGVVDKLIGDIFDSPTFTQGVLSGDSEDTKALQDNVFKKVETAVMIVQDNAGAELQGEPKERFDESVLRLNKMFCLLKSIRGDGSDDCDDE